MEATPKINIVNMLKRRLSMHTNPRGSLASSSYECTVMYSATYRAASDLTTYCATSTYFPWDGKTNGLKRQISNFSAKENEKFYECWERYMEAINACPHHGFDTWLLVSYFYDSMSSSIKQLLETMCKGDFMNKNRRKP
ncbi:hypothetical protein AAG906_027302 [Vitis piasezkii]